MSDHAFGLVELLLVFGIVLALALWDWRATRRALREPPRSPDDSGPTDPPPD